MKYFILLFVLHISIACLTGGQVLSQPSITWQNIYPIGPNYYNRNYGWDICPADSGNFFIVSSNYDVDNQAYILKINIYGDTIWTRKIDSIEVYSGVSSGDGGIVITGSFSRYPYDVHSLKLNKFGNIVWSKFYSNNGMTAIKTIKTHDGGYIGCGFFANYDGLLYKIDSVGEIVWIREYIPPYIYTLYGVIEDFNHDLIIYGSKIDSPNDSGQALIIKTDSQGIKKWEKGYYFLNRVATFYSLDTCDNHYILLASRPDTTHSAKIGIMKLNNDGEIINAYDLQNSTSWGGYGSSLKVINFNKYIVAYEKAYSLVLAHAYTDVIDSSGNILYNKEFDLSPYTEFFNILPVSDGYFFVGNSNYNQWVHAYVVKTDTILNFPPISIKKVSSQIPSDFILYQNYPNPFNPTTKIKFEIPILPLTKGEAEGVNHVTLIIYDILGREVATLVNEKLQQGTYEVDWNATNFASGVYFYKLQSGDFTETKKMVLLK